MKQTAAYYFLLLYITVLVQPVVPLVSNWWAHEFNNMEHLLKVHARFGSDHVRLQVAETSDHSDTADSQTASVNMKAPVHMATKAGFHFCSSVNVETQFWSIHCLQSSQFSPSPAFLPPRYFFV